MPLQNVECAVCRQSAHGLHFGVQACRACAAFFRRSVVNKLVYKCMRERKCDVTLKHRFSCRACRFEKCVELGMNMSMVHGIEQDNDSIPRSSPETPIKPLPMRPESSHDVEKVKAEVGAIFTKKLPTFSSSIMSGALECFRQSLHWFPDCVPDKLKHTPIINLEIIQHSTCTAVKFAAHFCMSVQAFADLPYDQKWIIFRRFWPQFYIFERFHRTTSLLGFDCNDHRTVMFDGNVIDVDRVLADDESIRIISNVKETTLRELFKPSCDKVRALLENPLKRIRPSEFEILFCILHVMWKLHNVPGITPDTLAIADEVLRKVCSETHAFYGDEMRVPNYVSRISRMYSVVNVMQRIEALRQEDSVMIRTFGILKKDIMLYDLTSY